MANEPGDNSPQPATRQSELLPAILAIALAVASQLAVQDGLTLLGLVGYIAAIWLFVASPRLLAPRLVNRFPSTNRRRLKPNTNRPRP
jgi:hypothetical protein